MVSILNQLEQEIEIALREYSPDEVDIVLDEEEECYYLSYHSPHNSHSIGNYKIRCDILPDEEGRILLREIENIADKYNLGTVI